MNIQEIAQMLGLSEIIIVPMTEEEKIAIKQALLEDNDDEDYEEVEEDEEDFEPKEIDDFLEQEAQKEMERFDNYVFHSLSMLP